MNRVEVIQGPPWVKKNSQEFQKSYNFLKKPSISQEAFNFSGKGQSKQK